MMISPAHSLTDHEFMDLLKSRCVGLTGGIATGKSTVAKMIAEQGYRVFDADQLARDIVRPGSPALKDITRIFGNDILTSSGEIDRNILRGIVMNSPEKRAALEAVTHPAIHKEFKSAVERSGLADTSEIFFYEAALLFETGRDTLFREVWATTCPKQEQIKRLMNRSKLGQEEAEKIITSQMPQDKKAAKAHRSVDTFCALPKLQSKVEDLIKTLK